jgi:hypothetical protein
VVEPRKLGGDRGAVPSKKTRAMAVEALQARADAKAADLAPIIKELQAAGKRVCGPLQRA